MYTSVFYRSAPVHYAFSNICKRYRSHVHRSVKSQTYSMCISLSMVNVLTFSVVDFRCD